MMKMRFILPLFALTAVLTAGEFESFEDDVEYLIKNLSKIRKIEKGSPYRTDYNKRLSGASVRASNLQGAVRVMGLKTIDLQTKFSNMCDFLSIDRRSAPRGVGERSGSFWIWAGELKKDIARLKRAEFNYEKRYYNPEKFTDFIEKESLKDFEKAVQNYKTRLFSKDNSSEAILKRNHDVYYMKIKRLSTEISRQATLRNLNLPQDCNLSLDVSEFLKASEKIEEYKVFRGNEQKKRDHKTKTASGIGKNKSESARKAKATLEYAYERVLNDISLLRQAGFDLKDKDKVETVPPLKQRTAGETDELFEKYRTARLELYRSENRRAGVSEDYYRNYEKILPGKQAEELRNAYAEAVANGIPAHMARAQSVRAVHTRYINDKKAVNPADLPALLERFPKND